MQLSFFLRHNFVLAIAINLVPQSTAEKDLCRACQDVVKSFKTGMSKTEKNNHGGGNTAWEEKTLSKYSKSQIRLSDITDHVCSEDEVTVNQYRTECNDFYDEHEEKVEDWYYNQQEKHENLEKYLCLDLTKVCCPTGTFGPECKPCPMNNNQICSGRGLCDGFGKRTGTGKCRCNSGYIGSLCDNCDSNYFSASNNSKSVLCKRCNRNCDGGCKGPGLQGCLGCTEGYKFVQDKGCEDVDECARADICKSDENEVCVNSVGSYECECKPGYQRDSKNKCELDIAAGVVFNLTAEQVLKYSALFGLSLCFLIILSRPSKLLWFLFFLTLLVVCYLEFSSIGASLRKLTEAAGLLSF